METPICILVVDDDADVVRATCRALDPAGYATVPAYSGAEVRPALRARPVQLVLLDRQLPDADGLDLCRQIKADPLLAGTFVVIVTAVLTSSEDRVAGLEAQADGYIERPLTNRELLARVEAFVRILRLNQSLARKAEDLQAKNEELERFHRLVVGRELRMAELKQEVSRLSQGEGETPRYWLNSPPTDATPEPLAPGDLQMATVNLLEDALLARQAAERVNEALRREIAQRQQVEGELRRALEEGQRLHKALNQMPTYVYMKDRESRYTFANQPTLRLFGCSAEDLAGCDDTRFFPPATVQRLREIDQRVLAGEASAQEIDVPGADGQRRVYWEIKSPIYSATEPRVITGLLGISTDITARKQAEEALGREQALSQTIVDSIPGSFYVLDQAGRYVRCNAYQREEIGGPAEANWAGFHALDTIHPEDRALIQARLTNVLTRGLDEVVEGRVLVKGGPAFRWLLMTGRRMMIGGQPFLVGIGIDITAQKEVEAALRREQAFTEQLFNAPHDTALLFDPATGKTLRWNRRFREVTGYSDEEIAAHVS